jgi:hypothetical protein
MGACSSEWSREASPKSMRKTLSVVRCTKILAGFKSLWMILFLCKSAKISVMEIASFKKWEIVLEEIGRAHV